MKLSMIVVLGSFACTLALAGCSDGGDAVPQDSGEIPSQEDADLSPSSAAPAPCESSDDCPTGVECRIAEGEQLGYCDVNEMVVSSPGDDGDVSLGAPAPCASDDECPNGVACNIADDDELGFCDVNETLVEP